MFKQKKKEMHISLIVILLTSLLVFYLYKIFDYTMLDNNYLRNLSYITIFSFIYFAIKLYFVYKKKENEIVISTFFLIEILIIVSFVSINWSLICAYFLFPVYILYATLAYGRKFGLFSLVISSLLMFGEVLGRNIVNRDFLFQVGTVYIIQIFVWYIASLINIQHENNNKLILEQQNIVNKTQIENSKLQESLTNFKQNNDELDKAYQKLELTNQRLNKNAAEYYTLQQISQAIVTILDINELLRFINDVIIGVMGANYSTILLLNKNTNTMDVEVTNITDDEELEFFKDNINCSVLNEVAQTGSPKIISNVSSEEYIFTQNRNINSMICVPLSRKNDKFGLVLVEQERADVFADEHLKFLSAISNQLSVALENVALYEKMQRMATIDALTNIYNRLYFNEMLAKEMAQADQNKYPMSIAIFDIDHFKKFNDTYGHLFGDLVLKTIAKLAKDHTRKRDTVSRFGGEEFVIIMPDTAINDAYEFIEELRTKISKCNIKDGSIVAGVTASFGISCYPQHGSNEAEVLSNADNALYKAKSEGRNCTRIYDGEQRDK